MKIILYATGALGCFLAFATIVEAQSVERTLHFINEKLQCSNTRIDPRPDGAVAVTENYPLEDRELNIRYKTGIKRRPPSTRFETAHQRLFGADIWSKRTVYAKHILGQDGYLFKLTDVKIKEQTDESLSFICTGGLDCAQKSSKNINAFKDRETASFALKNYYKRRRGCSRAKDVEIHCGTKSRTDWVKIRTCDKDTTERLYRAFYHLRKVLKPKKQLF